ncbi:MAG: hypothetical protein LC667_20675, partial [Thioalkalivibrio sp.]|nr:hypothetical protein [Thioalkalivibrio sp.]
KSAVLGVAIGLPMIAIASFLGGQSAGQQAEWVTGTAYLLGDESRPAFSVSVDGWSYAADGAVPQWIDEQGVLHEGGWPACLDPSRVSEEQREVPVRFATTDVAVDGVKWRPVLMVDCREPE